MKARNNRRHKLSDLYERNLETVRDNAFLDCAEIARGPGSIAFCGEGVRFAIEEVRKAGPEQIRELIRPQFAARARCEGMRVKGKAASFDAMAACLSGTTSVIARLTKVLSRRG